MAVDSPLAAVVMVMLCIVVSSKCFVGVYDQSTLTVGLPYHTDGICLWQTTLPTLPFQSVRSFDQPMP